MSSPARKLTMRDLIYKGSLIGAMVTGPSLAAFAALWHVSGDLMIAAAAGAGVHIASLFAAYRVARRFLIGGAPGS